MQLQTFGESSFPPGEFQNSALKLGHDFFLPNPLKLIIIYLWHYRRRCIV
jgi:hypothetical protein